MENTTSEINSAQTMEKKTYFPPAIVHELKMETRAGGTPNIADPLGVDPLGIDPSQPR